jgi:phage shock protein B
VFNPVEIIGVMIPIVAMVCVTVIVVIKVLRGGSRGRNESSAEDARVIQDIYNGLLKMEERIEALETIMVGRERSRKREE